VLIHAVTLDGTIELSFTTIYLSIWLDSLICCMVAVKIIVLKLTILLNQEGSWDYFTGSFFPRRPSCSTLYHQPGLHLAQTPAVQRISTSYWKSIALWHWWNCSIWTHYPI